MCNSAFLQGFSLYWWPKDESKRLKVLSLVICRRWNFIMESCWKCWKQTYLEGSEDIAVSSWLFVCTSCSIKRYHKVYSYLTSWTCWELGRRNSIKRSWSLTFSLCLQVTSEGCLGFGLVTRQHVLYVRLCRQPVHDMGCFHRYSPWVSHFQGWLFKRPKVAEITSRNDQQLVCCRRLLSGGISWQISLTLNAVQFYLERSRVHVVKCPMNGLLTRVISPYIPVYRAFYLFSSIMLMRAAFSTR